MQRSIKKSECVQMGSIIFNRLMDLKEDLKKDLQGLLHACGVDDLEDVKDVELYKIGCELSYNMEEIGRKAEDLANLMQEISDIDLSKC